MGWALHLYAPLSPGTYHTSISLADTISAEFGDKMNSDKREVVSWHGKSQIKER